MALWVAIVSGLISAAVLVQWLEEVFTTPAPLRPFLTPATWVPPVFWISAMTCIGTLIYMGVR